MLIALNIRCAQAYDALRYHVCSRRCASGVDKAAGDDYASMRDHAERQREKASERQQRVRVTRFCRLDGRRSGCVSRCSATGSTLTNPFYPILPLGGGELAEDAKGLKPVESQLHEAD